MPEVLLFAGPSTWGMPSAAFAGVDLRPPARRGDIDAVIKAGADPGVIVVCDGVFQLAPAVSHAELCRAIDAGWAVWGVSSLGAIRAHELRNEGMRGFGEVHAMFDRFDDFTDDEMCLLHFPEPPYFPVSEALVNLRFALERHGAACGVDAAAAAAIIRRLREFWFGDRTVDTMRAIMLECTGLPAGAFERVFDELRQRPVKRTDLEQLLAARPWRVRDDSEGTP